MTISKAGISRIKKPMKVNDIPPILKKTFFLIKEKAMWRGTNAKRLSQNG